MRTPLLALALVMLSCARGIAADAEKPPENIIKHYEWCATAKDAAERLARYEGFWTHYHPKSEEYEDAIHGTFVRLCGYRLAALYADTGNGKKCREMLQWLELHDQAIPR